jgi:hypothetical protein
VDVGVLTSIPPEEPTMATTDVVETNNTKKEEKEQKKRLPQDELVSIPSDLRKAYRGWFTELAIDVIAAALDAKQEEERTKGKRLSPPILREYSDEMEKLQRKFIALEEKFEIYHGPVLAHWGHTGIEKIEGELGETQIMTGISICADPQILMPLLSEEERQDFTEPRLVMERVLSAAANNPDLRAKLGKSLTASRVQVAIVPPSSQRGKAKKKEKSKKENKK